MDAIQSVMTLRSFQHRMMIESFIMVFFDENHTWLPAGPVCLELACTNRLPETRPKTFGRGTRRTPFQTSASAFFLHSKRWFRIAPDASDRWSTKSGAIAAASRSRSAVLAGRVTAAIIANTAYQPTMV